MRENKTAAGTLVNIEIAGLLTVYDLPEGSGAEGRTPVNSRDFTSRMEISN